MRIEAVTVCVNYADFLAYSLPLNKGNFDHLAVVTDSKDIRTQQLCEHYHVQCIVTDSFYHNERAFAKSAGINAGLAKLKGDDWICHLDADTVLPPRARQMLERAALESDCLYGIDRMMCTSSEDWLKHFAAPEIQHASNGFTQAQAFPLGVRIVQETGWAPLGYFQLWNARHTGIKAYPDHGAANRSDMEFALQWRRNRRHLIPEIVGIHLESEAPAQMGTNWRGRVSRPFNSYG